tara:strand:- start:505 stop:912 length:408 start_codon:yes stop_codon:yes gene_type:complete
MDRNTKKALRWDSGYRAKPVKSNKASFSSGKYSMAFACLNCKSTFQRSFLEAPCDYPLHSQCASCGGVTYNLGRNFKAPKKLDTAQWRKVAYLIQHGFYFQKIRPSKNSYYSVPYPSTLAEARVFVKKYKKYALI